MGKIRKLLYFGGITRKSNRSQLYHVGWGLGAGTRGQEVVSICLVILFRDTAVQANGREMKVWCVLVICRGWEKNTPSR